MSIRVDTSPLIPGAVVVGDPGHGVLGSEVPSTGEHGPGYLYGVLDLPADLTREVRGLITRAPTLGALTAFENSSFVYDGATDYFEFQFYRDGVAVGSPVRVDMLIVAGTIARPVSTVVSGTWLPSSGDELAAMLNEIDPDDETYIYTATPTTTRIRLDPVALPIDGVRTLKFRAWAPTSTGGLIVRLYDDDTLIATRTYTTLPASAATQTITLTEGEADLLTSGASLFLELEATA